MSVSLFVQVKTGPFAEHSNQLWNISAVPLWSKVHSGLIKMYRAEVSVSKQLLSLKSFLGTKETLKMLSRVQNDIKKNRFVYQFCPLVLHLSHTVMPPGVVTKYPPCGSNFHWRKLFSRSSTNFQLSSTFSLGLCCPQSQLYKLITNQLITNQLIELISLDYLMVCFG